ncbi:hypothetical protein HPB47_015491 [Ixodes persulcatus]|uniref:Uncharacterized protein n=1 Tax=Ixodes persulcatus TaxID=34615 RepID=A0AC60QUL8_IXOPE|nr:hypothetical protein HPB47_015491 [Ixodes persulcatus]
MDEFSRHGGLVYDEIKLSENINVTASGELSGFVDLGPFMEDSNETALSDHGLVVVFQPFKGKLIQIRKWTQILGVFASRGNVKAPVLSKILLEATILTEKSGLFVDFWTSDGAPWNRCLWKLLGIKGTVKYLAGEATVPDRTKGDTEGDMAEALQTGQDNRGVKGFSALINLPGFDSLELHSRQYALGHLRNQVFRKMSPRTPSPAVGASILGAWRAECRPALLQATLESLVLSDELQDLAFHQPWSFLRWFR